MLSPSILLRLNFSFGSSTSSLNPEWHSRTVNEACRQFLGISLLLLPQHALLVLLYGIPPTRCRPSQTDPPQASLGLQLQYGSVLWDLSFRNCSSMGPHGQQLPQPSFPIVASL